MDGITLLRRLMAQRPTSVVMCSSLTEEGSVTLMAALEAGAVDVILKPRIDTRQSLLESSGRICDAVKAAARDNFSRLPHRRPRSEARLAARGKLTADAMLAKPLARNDMARTTGAVACIGASTGGHRILNRSAGGFARRCSGDRDRSAHA